MRPRHRARPAAALACAAAILGAGLVAAPVSQAQPAPGGGQHDYVALGDSYSAATGVEPTDPAAPPECLRSLANYPQLVAEKAGLELTDVSCGGADTTDYRNAQYDDVPPQLDALQPGTDVVTMTIGGNDSGVFIDSILECGQEGTASGGQGHPCRDKYGSQFIDTIRSTTFPALRRALRDVQRLAPHAEVAILSYPWILPERVGCYPQMPVARGDVPYLRNLQRVLNNVVRRSAHRTGATYVDLNAISDGHDACQAVGKRWIEPVALGTNPVIVHPNALGEQRMARRTLRVLGLS